MVAVPCHRLCYLPRRVTMNTHCSVSGLDQAIPPGLGYLWNQLSFLFQVQNAQQILASNQCEKRSISRGGKMGEDSIAAGKKIRSSHLAFPPPPLLHSYNYNYILLTTQSGFWFLLMQFPHTGTSGNHMVLMDTKAPKRKQRLSYQNRQRLGKTWSQK